MVEIKNVEVYGLGRSIVASGNPMTVGNIDTLPENRSVFLTDTERASKLGKSKSGSGHDNFLKGIIVQFDIKYPQYFTPELQRYHWIDIISSQSKMHRLMTVGRLEEFHALFGQYVDVSIIMNVKGYITSYNYFCSLVEKDDGFYYDDMMTQFSKKDIDEKKYHYFMKALSNLPLGYEMWMTVSTNYLQLKTIYNQRKNHKLKEDWSVFCAMCEELPQFKYLIGLSN